MELSCFECLEELPEDAHVFAALMDEREGQYIIFCKECFAKIIDASRGDTEGRIIKVYSMRLNSLPSQGGIYKHHTFFMPRSSFFVVPLGTVKWRLPASRIARFFD